MGASGPSNGTSAHRAQPRRHPVSRADGRPTVWVVSCFSVRNEHRRKGVSAALLEAAVAYARDNGARVIEAYPVDNTTTKSSSNSLFVGALSTFLDAGFDIIAAPTATRRLVSLSL